MLQNNPMNDSLTQAERVAITRQVEYVTVEESFQRQKSIEHKLALGDGNTTYLFRSIQVKKAINKISCVWDQAGQLLENGSDIGDACVNFYKELFAPDVLSELKFDVFENMWHGPFIRKETQSILQSEVT